MDKGKFLRIVKTIVFIVGFALFQTVLTIYLKTSHGSEWSQIADTVLGLTFWLILWQLSSSAYENRRGLLRWVGASGLLKAFFVLVISAALASWGLMAYIEIAGRPHFDMLQLSSAIESFYIYNEKFPGPPGPITSEMIDDLRGSSNAHINANGTDYLKKAAGIDPFRAFWPWASDVTKDPWGHPFYVRFEPPYAKYPDMPDVIIISCGPNGKFENGGGDDIVLKPLVSH